MRLSTRQATILLAFVISARATSFMFSKICLTHMNAFSLIALRFTTASVILFLLFGRKILQSLKKENICSGIVIGSVFYLVLVSEHTGLKTTPASSAAFIENLAIIIVPFLECMLEKTLPSAKTLFVAVLAVVGVGILTMGGTDIGFSFGTVFLFAAAFLYAVGIILTAQLVKNGESFVIGFFQVTTTGVLAWGHVLLHGDFTMPQSSSQYVMILLLAVVCTCFGFTLQPVAQSRLSAETAGSFCALAPLVAAVCSCVFLKERFTGYSFGGAVLILLALAIQSGLITGLKNDMHAIIVYLKQMMYRRNVK